MRKGNACDITGLQKTMWDIGQKFVGDDHIKARFKGEASNIVKTVFQDVFHLPIEQMNAVDFTKGKLNTFERRLNKIKAASLRGKVTHDFGSLFYTPSGFAENNPQLLNLLNNLHNVNLGYQGRSDRHNRAFQNILSFMKKQMVIDGHVKAGKTLKKATKLATDFENKIEKTVIDVYNNVPGSKDELSRLLKEENEFYAKGEGKVFRETLETIEKDLPNLEFELQKKWWKNKTRLKKLMQKGKIDRKTYEIRKKEILEPIFTKYGMDNPDSKLSSQPMRNAVTAYVDLMDDMHKVLTDAVNAHVKTIKAGMKGKYTNDKVDEIGKKILDKITPDKKTGYFPHYRRVLNVDFLNNLMPHMQRVSDAVAENFKSDKASLDKAVDDMISYVNGHTKERQIIDLGEDFNVQNEYSRNFFPTLKRYIDEVDRFNMVSHADMYTREALNQAKEMFKQGKSIDGYARQTVEMMVDMNARMKGGYGFENENTEAIMKSLLAMEFVSKLGFNLRSPAKNATQGLLNIVEFGPSMILQSRNFYKNNKTIKRLVEDMMEDAGFLFADDAAPELVEGQMRGKDFTQKIKITDKEEIEFKKPGLLQKLHNKISKTAGVSGKLMAKVENINRKATFKMSFYKMYDQLNNSTAYRNELTKQGMSEKAINAEILKRARNYAIRKTTLLHFDYTDLAKSPWLLNPAGRLLGQFQHYGIKFLEYNIDKVKEGKDDILAGELTGERAKRAYNLGITYFLAPAIASAVTGLDFGNVVEHNTKQQVEKLWALFTGDEEDIKKAYYGKGVLTGLPFIGAPLFSDAIALGNLHEFIDMDNETMEMLLTGYEDYALKNDDQKAYETIRILNVALGRMAYKTLPMIMSGKPGSALQYELGIYQTKESKELKKNASDMVPKEVMDALAQLQQHQQRATSQGGFQQASGGKPRQRSSSSQLQRKSLLEQ
jgi:hypothetical protein